MHGVETGAEAYQRQGFVVVPLLAPTQEALLHAFAQDWLHGLLKPWTRGDRSRYPLETYHLWGTQLGVAHGTLFQAAHRHTRPPADVEACLLNPTLEAWLKDLGVSRAVPWDEGLGWLAFRFIRPGFGDGYPFTRKSWGPATTVISVWVPILGRSAQETLALLPGSHVEDHPWVLPTHTPFRKDEYRLAQPPPEGAVMRPTLSPGEVILYHPDVLHSEDVQQSDITRLNLEFRLLPSPGLQNGWDQGFRRTTPPFSGRSPR